MDARTRNLLLGLGGGVAAAALFPIVAPVVKELARPVTKALMRGGLLGLDYARTAIARLSESIEDIAAEVGAEVQSELASRSKAGAAGAVITVAAEASGSAPHGPHSVS